MTAKRGLALLLTLVLCIGLCSCSSNAGTNADLILWGESSGAKYLQNDEGQAAQSAPQKGVLKVQMARNEAEAVQLMMYANKDIACYNVTVSDLVSGKNVIPASSVEIFAELYQESVNTGQPSNPDYSAGYVPDPLLPIAAAVEHGETAIAKGNNQAVLLDVTTTAGTAPGVYSGVVTVTADEKTYQIPMEVTVHDIDLTGVEELGTAFSLFSRDHYASAELDSSDEMTKIYTDFLLKYNMSSRLPFEGNGGTERYVELLREYYFKDGFTAYTLYYEPTGSGYNGVGSNVNLPLLKEYVRAIAYASVEDRVNYLDKAYSYFHTDVDEPTSEEQFQTAKQTIDLYFQMLADCDAELRAELSGTEDYDYYANVVSPVLTTIPDVIPGSYDIDDVRAYKLDMLTVCPVLHKFASPSYSKYIREGREHLDVWMYTCWNPTYPYPNAHIKDTSLATRVLGWMCYELDTPVYLMWGTSCYTWMEHGDVVEDPWTTMHTGQPSAGDGKLTYPGAKYGIEGPCPSLRMVAYRDMSEDYQLLNVVRDLYAEQGLDADVVLEPLFRKIYTIGLIPNRDVDVFEQTRTELFELIMGLQTGNDVFYEAVDVDISTATVSFKTADGVRISVDGQEQTAGENGVYTFTVDLYKQQSFTFELKNGDTTRTVTRTLLDGVLGQVQDFEACSAVSDWVSCTGVNQVQISGDYAADGTQAVKITMNPNEEDALPFFALRKDSQLIGGSWKGIKTVKLNLYNPSEETVSLSVTYYTNQDVSMDSFELLPGQWTLIELALPDAAQLSDIDMIEEIDFNFQRGTSVTVYADSLVVVKEAQ